MLQRIIVGIKPRNRAKATTGKLVDFITRYEVEKNIAKLPKTIVGNTSPAKKTLFDV